MNARELSEAEQAAPQPETAPESWLEAFAYTDPTDAFGHTLHVSYVDAQTYDDVVPVVSLAITVPDNATDPENPVVYVPITDVPQVIEAMRHAAGQAPTPYDHGTGGSPCQGCGHDWFMHRHKDGTCRVCTCERYARPTGAEPTHAVSEAAS